MGAETLRFQEQQLDVSTVVADAERLIEEVQVAKERREQSMYLLPRTGFDVRGQIDLLENNLQEGKERGESTERTLNGSLEQIGQDVQGFKLEYLTEGPLFPIVLGYKDVGGQRRVSAPLYNDKLLVDTVSDKERKGSVKRVAMQLEEELLAADEGTFFAPSPAGWSGLKDPNGNKITYPDAQTYMWQKQKDGSIRGFTIKTNMTLSQNEELLERFGVSKAELGYRNSREGMVDTLSSEDRVSTIAGKLVRVDQGKNIEDIISIIQEIKGSPVAFRDTTGKERTFYEIFTSLKNPQLLWTLDETTRKLVDTFSIFVRQQLRNGRMTPEIRENIETALGMTILKIASLINPEVTQKQQDEQYGMQIMSLVLAQVQQIGGCNGGGMITGGVEMTSGIFVGTLAPRNAEVRPEDDPNLCRCAKSIKAHFHCPGTKEGTPCKHPINVGEGITKCPSCGESKKC